MSELVLLTEDEFDALTPAQQARYLDLLSAELGEPTPSPVQARAMALADEVDELLYGGAAGPGKALDLATPILTTRGWSTMGDLNVGDEVYGPDGQPTRIVAATAPMVDHECWRLTFDDGASIVADASHLWLTKARQEAGFSLKTTGDLAATVDRRHPHLLPARIAQGRVESFYVVAAEQVESRPVRCITVARADGMFLAGDHLIPTHNSWFMRHRAQALSRKYPGHKTLLLRESFPELRRTHIRDAIAQYAVIPASERPEYRSSTYEWTFPNGSVIEFGHCATDDDVRSYLSAEYDCIMVDESSEFSEYRLTMLRSRLRTSFQKASLGVKPHMILGSNPGGIGHKYHVDRFIKPTDYGEHVATITDEWNNRKVERTVAFVKARVTDNPHIDPGYIDNLISLPEALRKQYLEGDWDSFEGQFWSEFERERAGRPWHVVPPFEVPPDWPRIRGMDFGNAAPFCCLWIAFDHDGDAYVYREMYEKNVTASEQARRVLKASVMREAGIPKPERIDYTMLDPACWSQHQPGQSIAMQYADEGLYARKGDNQRIAGWTRIRDYLAEDETGKPGLRIFATCTNLIDEMTNALYDKIHVEDLNTKKADHAMDALRYALMSRPRAYTPKKPPPDMSMEAKVDRHFARMERRKKRRLPEGLGGL